MLSCVTCPSSFRLKCLLEHRLPAFWLGIHETSAAGIKTCQGWLSLPGLQASGAETGGEGLVGAASFESTWLAELGWEPLRLDLSQHLPNAEGNPGLSEVCFRSPLVI